MKKFLKRALPLALALALVFTLSAGAFAAVNLDILGIFKLPLIKNEKLKDTALGLYNGIVKPNDPKKETDQSTLELMGSIYDMYSSVDPNSETLYEDLAKMSANVAVFAGAEIATGEICLPTYIDVLLPKGTTEAQVVKVYKGSEELTGVNLDVKNVTVATVEVPGYIDSYGYYTGTYIGVDENGKFDCHEEREWIRIYNYDTADATITVLLDYTDILGNLDEIISKYSLEGTEASAMTMTRTYTLEDAGLISTCWSMGCNFSLFKPKDATVSIKAIIKGNDEGEITINVKNGFKAIFNGLKKKISKKSFLEFILS